MSENSDENELQATASTTRTSPRPTGQPGDDRGVDDPLDEGYSPPEKWSAAEGFGNTPLRGGGSARRSTSASRRRSPSRTRTTRPAAEGEDVGGEVGDRRAGRLVDEDEGLGPDLDDELVGDDVGIDGAGASAEEAAVHVIDDDETA